MREDVLDFCEELEKVSDESVNLWDISKDEVSSFAIFSGSNSQRILGCILGVDKTLVSEKDWENLWNKK